MASSEQSPGVFLDTCFLVTLCDAKRQHHATAKEYFRYWVQHGIPMFVSSIVYAEFLVREELPAIVADAVTIVPFDALAAHMAGKIMKKRQEYNLAHPAKKAKDGEDSDEQVSRDEKKDDFKIIAHACEYGVKTIATEDARSMAGFVRFTAEHVQEAAEMSVILLQNGFDLRLVRCVGPELGFDV